MPIMRIHPGSTVSTHAIFPRKFPRNHLPRNLPTTEFPGVFLRDVAWKYRLHHNPSAEPSGERRCCIHVCTRQPRSCQAGGSRRVLYTALCCFNAVFYCVFDCFCIILTQTNDGVSSDLAQASRFDHCQGLPVCIAEADRPRGAWL